MTTARLLEELPLTPEADAVRKYVTALETKDFTSAAEFFAEDVVFNGVHYKISGLEKLQICFQDYCKNLLLKSRLEAVNEAGAPDRYLMMHWDIPVGGTEEQIVADYISLRDGKIARIDNCLDDDKVPEALKDDAKKVSD